MSYEYTSPGSQSRGSVRHAISNSYLKLAAIVTVAAASLIIRESEGARDIGPEPLDVFNHVGNVGISVSVGYCGSMVAGAVAVEHANMRSRKGEDTATSSICKKMVAGGIAAGIIVNGLVETKTGISLIGWENTPDPVDFAYGVGGAAIGGLIPKPRVEES